MPTDRAARVERKPCASRAGAERSCGRARIRRREATRAIFRLLVSPTRGRQRLRPEESLAAADGKSTQRSGTSIETRYIPQRRRAPWERQIYTKSHAMPPRRRLPSRSTSRGKSPRRGKPDLTQLEPPRDTTGASPRPRRAPTKERGGRTQWETWPRAAVARHSRV